MIAKSLKWSRHNLFAKPFDVLLSLTVIPGVLWLFWQIASWALTVAQWDIIPQSLRVLMIGIFPVDQVWRTWVAAMIIAAECFTRLMRSVITTLKQDQSFRASLCSTDQPSAGERNVLSALPPVNLFWELLGVSRITPNEVILQNHCPLPGPITVQYQGMDITFQSKSSVVRFSNLESVTVTKPGLRRVHR